MPNMINGIYLNKIRGFLPRSWATVIDYENYSINLSKLLQNFE